MTMEYLSEIEDKVRSIEVSHWAHQVGSDLQIRGKGAKGTRAPQNSLIAVVSEC